MKIRVGLGSCGIAASGNNIYDVFNSIINDKGLDVEIEPTGCIGMCFYEPIVDILEHNKVYSYINVDEDKAKEIAEKHLIGGHIVEEFIGYSSDVKIDYIEKQHKIALENCGLINPNKIDDYIENDGYKATKKVLLEMTSVEVIDELRSANLRGRGGAGFPTWFKWDAAYKSPGDVKYIVCNADEGDPGAFMDRSLLEGDPHRVIEGMIIGGYTIGANTGLIYCRAEYPLAIERLQIAIDQAKERGYLGKNIFGTDFDFDLIIKKGAGAFVCGEETALIESLEGKRGMPRLKPPYPAQSGYWNKPTNINNVETLANIPYILRKGGKAYATIGSEKSTGTKVFALSGKIKNGGLVEVPMGITLREIIFGIGGGIKEGGTFKAVQLGGPSGGCIPPALLDTLVTYEDINETGAIMGSGGMVVMDESTCMVDIAKFFLEFTCEESCGKCTYCRIGTKRMYEILVKITEGQGELSDLDELEELASSIKNASLCGLGQTAPNPVLTGLKYFRDEYVDHIVSKKCIAKKCTNLLTYSIVEDKCIGCSLCSRKCPVEAIDGVLKSPYHIDDDKCIKCGNCVEACKFDAIIIV